MALLSRAKHTRSSRRISFTWASSIHTLHPLLRSWMLCPLAEMSETGYDVVLVINALQGCFVSLSYCEIPHGITPLNCSQPVRGGTVGSFLFYFFLSKIWAWTAASKHFVMKISGKQRTEAWEPLQLRKCCWEGNTLKRCMIHSVCLNEWRGGGVVACILLFSQCTIMPLGRAVFVYSCKTLQLISLLSFLWNVCVMSGGVADYQGISQWGSFKINTYTLQGIASPCLTAKTKRNSLKGFK